MRIGRTVFSAVWLPKEVILRETILNYPAYWKSLGVKDITAALSREQNNGVAKNVIVFVGDGMGMDTITAARIYGKTEKKFLAFEKFTNIGVLKTYSSDKLGPDSASTATALFCGAKANVKTSGVDASVSFDDCDASLNGKSKLESIVAWAQDAGKSTGFVTTTRVTHATPSALYAHTPNRAWECEAKIPRNVSKCKDIGRQLVEDVPGKNINVIMGGGRQCLVSDVSAINDDPIDTWCCFSTDGRNLIQDWKNDKTDRHFSHAVVTNNKELDNLDVNTEFVLGIFANSHLKMNHARNKNPEGMPSLTNMTAMAIALLQKNPNGYLLMVEGGLIDYAHHRGHARQALSETLEFSNAVEKALEMTHTTAHETLIIVTSDHSHSLVFAGNANRFDSIFKANQKSEIDGIPYTPLLYATAGADNFQYDVVNNRVIRRNPTLDDTEAYNYAQQTGVLVDEAKHSGTDVLVYAQGPMAHLFHSVHEQTYVAYVISYAAKIGPLKQNNGIRLYIMPYLLISIICIHCFYTTQC